MSYGKLYEFCQRSETVPISRKVLIPEVCRLTGFKSPRIFMDQLKDEVVRGYFIAPNHTDHVFVKQCGGAPVIVVARGLNYCWQRFVIVKELMHYFDEPLQRTNSIEEFNLLLSEFTAPTPHRSEAMYAEVLCMWMALGVLCPELQRQEFMRSRKRGTITELEVAKNLKLPAQYVPHLLSQEFKHIISSLV